MIVDFSGPCDIRNLGALAGRGANSVTDWPSEPWKGCMWVLCAGMAYNIFLNHNGYLSVVWSMESLCRIPRSGVSLRMAAFCQDIPIMTTSLPRKRPETLHVSIEWGRVTGTTQATTTGGAG